MLAMPADREELCADTHPSDFESKMSVQGKVRALWELLHPFAGFVPLTGLKMPLVLSKAFADSHAIGGLSPASSGI